MGRVLKKRCPPEVVTGRWRKTVPAELAIADSKLVLTHAGRAALGAGHGPGLAHVAFVGPPWRKAPSSGHLSGLFRRTRASAPDRCAHLATPF